MANQFTPDYSLRTHYTYAYPFASTVFPEDVPLFGTDLNELQMRSDSQWGNLFKLLSADTNKPQFYPLNNNPIVTLSTSSTVTHKLSLHGILFYNNHLYLVDLDKTMPNVATGSSVTGFLSVQTFTIDNTDTIISLSGDGNTTLTNYLADNKFLECVAKRDMIKITLSVQENEEDITTPDGEPEYTNIPLYRTSEDGKSIAQVYVNNSLSNASHLINDMITQLNTPEITFTDGGGSIEFAKGKFSVTMPSIALGVWAYIHVPGFSLNWRGNMYSVPGAELKTFVSLKSSDRSAAVYCIYDSEHDTFTFTISNKDNATPDAILGDSGYTRLVQPIANLEWSIEPAGDKDVTVTIQTTWWAGEPTDESLTISDFLAQDWALYRGVTSDFALDKTPVPGNMKTFNAGTPADYNSVMHAFVTALMTANTFPVISVANMDMADYELHESFVDSTIFYTDVQRPTLFLVGFGSKNDISNRTNKGIVLHIPSGPKETDDDDASDILAVQYWWGVDGAVKYRLLSAKTQIPSWSDWEPISGQSDVQLGATTLTVTADAWTTVTDAKNGDYYTQTISVPNIKNTDSVAVDVVLTEGDRAASEAAIEAYGCVSQIAVNDNNVKIYCYDQLPTINFRIQLQVLRSEKNIF